MFNVYMDDLRPGPNNGFNGQEIGWEDWVIVRSTENVKTLLKLNLINDLSLDHDMGYNSINPSNENPSGKALVLWMIENNCWPKGNIFVHSANPIGSKSMRELIEKHRDNHLTIKV